MKFLAIALCAISATLWAESPDRDSLDAQKEEPPAMVHWARGEAHGGGGSRTSPNMTNHGGPILPSVGTHAIFWGTSWGSYVGDKISGMDSFYAGVGNTTYANTCNEYTSGATQVASGISYAGHTIDTSAAPSRAPQTSAILAEVCKVFPHPVANDYYAVYVDTKRGSAGYCAWHSAGSCNGTAIEFSFFFNLDGDPGCDPQDTSTGHSQGLAAIANVSGHELSETRTDPKLNAWYDSQGQENGDKCAWTFGVPYVPFSDGTNWKIQGNWSNAAYSGGTGYPNSSGQKGCLDSSSNTK